jgi:hypothetical protein
VRALATPESALHWCRQSDQQEDEEGSERQRDDDNDSRVRTPHGRAPHTLQMAEPRNAVTPLQARTSRPTMSATAAVCQRSFSGIALARRIGFPLELGLSVPEHRIRPEVVHHDNVMVSVLLHDSSRLRLPDPTN